MHDGWKRLLFGTAMLVSGSAAYAEPAPAPACPPIGTGNVDWIGVRLLQGGKGYVATPMGQVHYRMVGQGSGPAVLLLHQSPWSMIEYGEIQACLAAKGVRSIAVDTPGYGMSDAPEGIPTVAQYADNLVPVLDALKIGPVVVAGHHTGSVIAAAFAARYPKRTLGLIMQGLPLYSREERLKMQGPPQAATVLKDDGAHLSDTFKAAREYAGPDPRTKITATWSVIERYQTGINDVARDVVTHNDMAADLAKVRAPALILTDAKDFLHPNDLRGAKLFPRFKYLQFSDATTHSLMIDPARWAGVVADFVAKDVKR